MKTAQDISPVKPAFMTVPIAAAYTSLGRRTIWRMLSEGELTREKIRSRTVVRTSELDALLEAQTAA